MSFNNWENKEKEEKIGNTSLLTKIQSEKSIQNINKDRGINKKKLNKYLSYLTVFKVKEFFKNVQMVNKKHTNGQNPNEKEIKIVSSKYVNEYNGKDITKKGDYLIKEERKNSREASEERNNCYIQFFVGKRNASSSKEKKHFHRNYILKSELYKKTGNEEKTNVNIFPLKKNITQENQYYNYYYNNLKEYILPKFSEIKDDEKKSNKNEGDYIQIYNKNNSKNEILINKQNNNYIKKEFKSSDEIMIVKKITIFRI